MKLGVGLIALAVSGLFLSVHPAATVTVFGRRDKHARDLDVQQSENIQQSRKREAVGDVRENALQKVKRAEDARLSFKECNLDAGMREDCGYHGIDEVDCYRRGCCWGETEAEGVPWCYHSKPTQIPQCVLDSPERNECGSYSTSKEECMAKMCCWRPSNQAEIPWCFHYRREPVFEGECGVPRIPPLVTGEDSKIVNGIEAKEHSWPWMVSLQNSRGHYCGGSLVNEQWVLTAAHCEGVFDGGDGILVVGIHSQTEQAQFQRNVSVAQIIPHSGWDRYTIDKDIMLLKLSEKIEFGETIQPVCLPAQGERLPAGTRCYTTGWGTLQYYAGDIPDKLQQVLTPLIADDTCNQEGWYDRSITDNMVCAGYQQGGRAACHGDSGGPLVCYMEDHWLLYGIVSWSYGCAEEEHPTVFARVSNFATWVEQTVSNDQ